ncbi:hypothetical protein [Xenorhabdus sp. Sc-CR9]|uniref:hypothetical protein n=1 Tax=Xenorhabdus sp. Sc-CR9 TaxID=2584468 RepID=UPI001F16599E|nr:hypothetical protein [Xenorhabdus sp. Sc-CR9]
MVIKPRFFSHFRRHNRHHPAISRFQNHQSIFFFQIGVSGNSKNVITIENISIQQWSLPKIGYRF